MYLSVAFCWRVSSDVGDMAEESSILSKDHGDFDEHTITPHALYSPLDTTKKEVRFCRTGKVPDTHRITCTLIAGQLADTVRYKCLSYVWGEIKQKKTIDLNLTEKEVTDNLFAALTSLEAFEGDGLLWIDALCINQNDLQEKTQQVALMADIYRGAEEVLVCLHGPPRGMAGENGDAEVGASTIDVDVSAAVGFLQDLSSDKHFHEMPYFSKCHAPACPSQREEPERDWKSAFLALTELMDSEWFSRTWTIQEIALAKNASILYRNHRIPWELVVEGFIAWTKHLNECCSK